MKINSRCRKRKINIGRMFALFASKNNNGGIVKNVIGRYKDNHGCEKKNFSMKEHKFGRNKNNYDTN